MAKQIVDRGGFLLLGSSAGASDLFDGQRLEQASLTRSVQTVDTTGSGDPGYATYYSQSATGDPATLDQVLFEGDVVVVTKVADSQSQGEFETQEIALRSTGTPVKPPYGA